MFKDLNQGQTQYSQTFYNEKVYIDWLKEFLNDDNCFEFDINYIDFQSFMIIGDKDHPDAIYLYYHKDPLPLDSFILIGWSSDFKKYLKKN